MSEDYWRYVRIGTLPKKVPSGKVLVHNQVQHEADTTAGWNGFRAWYSNPSDHLSPCDCGWANLPHFRPKPSPPLTAPAKPKPKPKAGAKKKR